MVILSSGCLKWTPGFDGLDLLEMGLGEHLFKQSAGVLRPVAAWYEARRKNVAPPSAILNDDIVMFLPGRETIYGIVAASQFFLSESGESIGGLEYTFRDVLITNDVALVTVVEKVATSSVVEGEPHYSTGHAVFVLQPSSKGDWEITRWMGSIIEVLGPLEKK